MERLGPESLMVMAAARISRLPPLEDRALWELPVTETARAPELLAAAPVHRIPARRTDGRGWFGWWRDWAGSGRAPRGL